MTAAFELHNDVNLYQTDVIKQTDSNVVYIDF